MIVLAGGTILLSFFLLAGNLIFNGSAALGVNQSPEEVLSSPAFIKFALIVQDISYFIIPSFIILAGFDPGYGLRIVKLKNISAVEVLLVIILAISAFPVTGLAGRLNSGMVLPDSLSGMEHWMKDKENYADNLLETIMSAGSFWGMMFNLLLIAALPAIGEELIFRGVFQNILKGILRSGHLAVWITAVLFSAVHFQFYGFLPRMLLGVMFGYLFLWSGNIWLPVLAHFINNAVPTAGAYFKGWEVVNGPSVENIGKQIPFALIALLGCIVILLWFRRRSDSFNPEDPDPTLPEQM